MSIAFFMMIPNLLQANNVKNSAVILMYHKFDVSKHPSTNIRIEQFEDHLIELSKQKYNVKSLEYIANSIINDIDLPENTIGISIDDADKSFLKIAWPRFKEYNFPVTLFVSTKSIGSGNYLSWDDIRFLKNEGVEIGAHSHTHNHLPNLNKDEIINEIEFPNKIFMKELNKIPSLFAYPYGETNQLIIDIIQDYKFKIAFGQHSGVINETSHLYFLPRFALNEKYGDLERFKFIVNAKGLGVYDFIPSDPTIKENPPFIGFSLLDQNLTKNIQCFIYDSDGQVENNIFNFNERLEIRLGRKLNPGRTRMNCTAKDNKNNWRWFGHQFYTIE